MSLLEEIRLKGFLPEPEDVGLIYHRLSNAKLYKGKIPQSSVGIRYLDNVFPHRFEARTLGLPSFKDAFHDDRQIHKILDYLVKNDRLPTQELVLRNLHYNIHTPSHFFPESAAALCNEYGMGKSIYDVFTGWGGRSLGAICANAKTLVSTDTQSLSTLSGKRMLSDFSKLSPTQAEFINCNFAEYMGETGALFDLIIASPPFFGTEIYGESGISDVRSWVDRILHPLVRGSQRILKDNGIVAIHGQDRTNLPILTMIYSAFSCFGFVLKHELKYGKKPGQAILVFSKVN